MYKEVIIFCMTGNKSIKKKFDDLSVLGWDNIPSRIYVTLLNNGVKNNEINIQAKYIYMSVDRPFYEGVESITPEDLEMIDVYFNGELIITCDGWFDENNQKILTTDYEKVITEYFFNNKMWEEIVVMRSKKK